MTCPILFTVILYN